MAQRFMDREGILIVLLSGLSLIFLAAAGFTLYNPPLDEPAVMVPVELDHTPVKETGDTSTTKPAGPVEFVVEGEDGMTALDVLKRDHQVKLDSELLIFGSIVLSIDSVEAHPDEVWVFYRDTVLGNRSPDLCTTYTGEQVRWILKQRR